MCLSSGQAKEGMDRFSIFQVQGKEEVDGAKGSGEDKAVKMSGGSLMKCWMLYGGGSVR